jgi:hypothetical protein
MAKKRIKHDTPDSYEVGYGKPPKHTRFEKGVSGNPKGRPKVIPDFAATFLREAETRITINENGRPVRVSKRGVIVKQLINNAMKGKTSDVRLYLNTDQGASEKIALLAPASPESSMRADDLTDDQLAWIIAQGREQAESKEKGENILPTE